MGKKKQWCSLTRVCSLVYGQNKPVLLGYLAAGTVNSLIGKLRSNFNALGRSGDWDDRSGFGNPALHLSVN